jgi:peptidoglycan-associated lipoprotein
MKHSFVLKLLVASVILLVSATGCKPKIKSPTPVPAGKLGVAPTGGPDGPGGPTVRVPSEVDTRSAPPPNPPIDQSGIPLPIDPDTGMKRDEAIFKAYTVYFDFDKSSVKSSERSKIEAVANHLKAEPTNKVKVEGHCDERGTEGYNLSLGERRALAVRKYLIDLGISADRVYTISFGEARPATEGHTESAWAKNRRGDFILLLP